MKNECFTKEINFLEDFDQLKGETIIDSISEKYGRFLILFESGNIISFYSNNDGYYYIEDFSYLSPYEFAYLDNKTDDLILSKLGNLFDKYNLLNKDYLKNYFKQRDIAGQKYQEEVDRQNFEYLKSKYGW